ncbi:MAG: signal peptidase II [Phycisphaerales bacterium]
MTATAPTETAATLSRTRPLPAARSMVAWVTLLMAFLIGLGVDLTSKRVAFERVAGAPVALDRAEILQDPTWSAPAHREVVVIPKLLSFKLVVNHGAVFGIGPGQRFFFMVFTLLAMVAGGVIFAFKTTARDRLLHIAIGCVLAGAAGNLYDRWTYGVVRDFLNIFPGMSLPFGLNWPGGSPEVFPWVFNIADMLLLFGIGVLVVRVGGASDPPKPSVSSAPGGDLDPGGDRRLIDSTTRPTTLRQRDD